MGPTRCRAFASCLPQGRRCRHDDSAGNVGPWRRLHDNAERSGAGFDPSERFGCDRDTQRSGPRPAGRFGRRLRPMGSLAEAVGRRGGSPGRPEKASPTGAGPLRSCFGAVAFRRLHRAWHAPGRYRPSGSDPHGVELAGQPATCVAGAGGTDRPDEQAADRWRFGGGRALGEYITLPHRGRPGPFARTAGTAALPQYPPAGRAAGECGGEL